MSDSHLLVDETDFHDALVSEALPPEPLEDGEARLRVDHWALTANNVSYALEGQRLGYWHYFPGLQGRGRVPAWGFADVVESAHADLPIGQRIYGFVPMSTRFTVKAESKRDGFVDASPHRASLPAFYNRYSLVEKRPIEEETLRAVLQPLFGTAFLLDHFVRSSERFAGAQLVLTSASSKTAWATAHLLRRRDVAVVGLTSERNLEFVKGLGPYAEVFSYDQAASVAERDSVVLDFAGQLELRETLRARLGDRLLHTAAIGASHWDASEGIQIGDAEERTEVFMAPFYAPKAAADVGPQELASQVQAGLQAFGRTASRVLRVTPRRGVDEVREAWLDAVRGAVPPTAAISVGW